MLIILNEIQLRIVFVSIELRVTNFKEELYGVMRLHGMVSLKKNLPLKSNAANI